MAQKSTYQQKKEIANRIKKGLLGIVFALCMIICVYAIVESFVCVHSIKQNTAKSYTGSYKHSTINRTRNVTDVFALQTDDTVICKYDVNFAHLQQYDQLTFEYSPMRSVMFGGNTAIYIASSDGEIVFLSKDVAMRESIGMICIMSVILFLILCIFAATVILSNLSRKKHKNT